MPLGYNPICTAGISTGGNPAVTQVAQTAVTVSGVAASGAIGTASGRNVLSVPVAGLLGTSFLQAVASVSGGANPAPTGVVGTTGLGPLDSLSFNGNLTKFLAGLSAKGSLGDASAVVRTNNLYLTLSGVSATSAVGSVTVPGVQSTYYTDFLAVPAATGNTNDTSITYNAALTLGSFEMSLPDPTNVHVTVSSFGLDITAAQVSQWTPVSPTA